MKNEFAITFADLINKYNEYREEWITVNGTDAGFDEWFTKQVGIK